MRQNFFPLSPLLSSFIFLPPISTLGFCAPHSCTTPGHVHGRYGIFISPEPAARRARLFFPLHFLMWGSRSNLIYSLPSLNIFSYFILKQNLGYRLHARHTPWHIYGGLLKHVPAPPALPMHCLRGRSRACISPLSIFNTNVMEILFYYILFLFFRLSRIQWFAWQGIRGMVRLAHQIFASWFVAVAAV